MSETKEQQQQKQENISLSHFPLDEKFIRQLFDQLDTDKNGVVDPAEATQIFRLARIPAPSKSQQQKFFDTVDTNHDGVIEFSELYDYLTRRQLMLQEIYLAIIDQRASIEKHQQQKMQKLTQQQQQEQQQKEQKEVETSATAAATKIKVQVKEDSAGKQEQEQKQEKIAQSIEDEKIAKSLLTTPRDVSTLKAPRSAFTASTLRSAAFFTGGKKLSRRQVREMMKLLDIDNDNFVTFDEFCEVLLLIPDVSDFGHFFDSVDYFQEGLDSGFAPTRSLEQPVDDIDDDLDDEYYESDDEFEKFMLGSSDVGIANAQDQWRRLQEHTEHKIEQRKKDKTRTIIKRTICGGISGIVSRTMLAPLDVARLQIMCSDKKLTMADAIKSTVKKNGAIGLFKGNGLMCVKAIPDSSIKFTCYSFFTENFVRDPDDVKFSERLLFGGAAGALSQMSVYPVDVLRTRAVTVDTYKGLTFPETAKKMVATEGIRSLYSGWLPTCCGIIPYCALDLSINDYLKMRAADYMNSTGRYDATTNSFVGIGVLLTCGMISSSIAMTVTFPVNTVRTIAMQKGYGVSSIVKHVFKHRGIKGFFSGIGASFARVVPGTAISYAVYDTSCDNFDKYYQRSKK